MSLIRKKGNAYLIDCYGYKNGKEERKTIVLKLIESKFRMMIINQKNFQNVENINSFSIDNKLCQNFKIVVSKYGTTSLMITPTTGDPIIITLFQIKAIGDRPNNFLSFYSLRDVNTIELTPKNFKCRIPATVC